MIEKTSKGEDEAWMKLSDTLLLWCLKGITSTQKNGTRICMTMAKICHADI